MLVVSYPTLPGAGWAAAMSRGNAVPGACQLPDVVPANVRGEICVCTANHALGSGGSNAQSPILLLTFPKNSAKTMLPVMETADRKYVDEWIARWIDTVDFEVYVISSKEAAERVLHALE